MLSELVFPKRCLGCSKLGEILCLVCLRNWKHEVLITHVAGLKVYSTIIYTPVASRVLLAAKENGIKVADELVVSALGLSLSRAVKDLGSNLVVVPIPSQKQAVRVRGRNFNLEVVQRAAKVQAIPVRQLLGHVRRVKDQATLDAQSRRLNVHHSLALLDNPLRSREVILADDLVTTGSTLIEATRALRAGQIAVLAAITACVAEPLR